MSARGMDFEVVLSTSFFWYSQPGHHILIKELQNSHRITLINRAVVSVEVFQESQHVFICDVMKLYLNSNGKVAHFNTVCVTTMLK